MNVTERQKAAAGVKTRFVSCKVTLDTRRKQEQLGGDVGERMNTNYNENKRGHELRDFRSFNLIPAGREYDKEKLLSL